MKKHESLLNGMGYKLIAVEENQTSVLFGYRKVIARITLKTDIKTAERVLWDFFREELIIFQTPNKMSLVELNELVFKMEGYFNAKLK